MKTIVATSINPFSKVEYQKLCFDKWKSSGVKVKTFNTKKECEVLLKSGFDRLDIEEIDITESGLDLFGKEMPRIMPILERLKHGGFDNSILVNSDIYPSINNDPSLLISRFGDVACLTRNECVDVGCHQYIESNPYRGGLDIFYFSKYGLDVVAKKLRGSDVASRMTFGIPGWDYYLAHFILQINENAILDSEVFLHQSHKTTYAAIDEFSHYAERMIKSGIYQAKSAVDLASEFKRRINQIAEKNRDKSIFLKKVFYYPFRGDIQFSIKQEEVKILERIRNNFELVGYPIKSNKKLISFFRSQNAALSWSSGYSYGQAEFRSENTHVRCLLCILLMLIIKNHFGKSSYSIKYPKGNLHGAALKQIIANLTGKEQHKYINSLFAVELIDYSIFNPYLYNYIVLSSTGSRDLKICSEIKKIVHEGDLKC